MNLFYTNNIKDNIATFDEVETRHCIHSLRMKVGEVISFVDGKGNWYQGAITSSSKKNFQVSVNQTEVWTKNRSNYLHIAIAPTKNITRFEWFLEKATEIGIDEITPILTFHSERKRIRVDRLEKIVLSAMKQSLKAHLPKINELIKYKDWLKTDLVGKKYIAYVEEKNLQLKDTIQSGQDVTILIGPEGGFSKEEVELAKNNNFVSVSLGSSRLRTETAAIVACHTNQIINEI